MKTWSAPAACACSKPVSETSNGGLARKTLEVELLKRHWQRRGGKTELAVAVAATRRFSVKVVAGTLGVARSNLVEQTQGYTRHRSHYRRQGDDELLQAIGQLTDARPTYGYRRITALLNCARRASGAELINHKRVPPPREPFPKIEGHVSLHLVERAMKHNSEGFVKPQTR
jgi:hypothetical protein